MAVVFANQWTDTAPTGLRNRVEEILATMPGDGTETDEKGRGAT